jgi:hypothetical protein
VRARARRRNDRLAVIADKSPSPWHSGKNALASRPCEQTSKGHADVCFARLLAGDGDMQARGFARLLAVVQATKTRSVMLPTKATTWAAWIAAVLVLTASSMASGSSVLLSPNSCLGKNTLEGGLHRGSAAVSAETCRGYSQACSCDAAGLFVAPTTGARASQPEIAAGLGGRRNVQLRGHAEATGGRAYWDWEEAGLTSRPVRGVPPEQFGQAAEEAFGNAGRIHFDLTNIADARASAAEGARLGWQYNNLTNAELNLIRSRPDLLGKTTFYRNGRVVPNPFAE